MLKYYLILFTLIVLHVYMVFFENSISREDLSLYKAYHLLSCALYLPYMYKYVEVLKSILYYSSLN